MIRKYKETDIDEILNIWLEASILSHDFIDSKYWHKNIPNMRDIYIPSSKSYVYTHKDTDKPIAFISLLDNHIAAIFVHIDKQGLGIGSSLLNFAKLKHTSLSITVYKKNLNAIQFYLANQFEIIDDSIDELTNEKELLMRYNS